MLLPDQPTMKMLLDIPASKSPYANEGSLEAARKYTAAKTKISCTHCGLSFGRDALSDVIGKEVGPSYVSSDYAGQLESIFRFSWNIDGLKDMKVDESRGDILCRGCFELENCMNPLSPYAVGHGGFGLYGALSQSDLMLMWRALLIGATQCEIVASALAKSWSGTFREASTALTRALYGRSADTAAPPSARDLCEWGAATKPENWEEFQISLPDFRFLPAQEITKNLRPYAAALAASPSAAAIIETIAASEAA